MKDSAIEDPDHADSEVEEVKDFTLEKDEADSEGRAEMPNEGGEEEEEV